MLAFLPALMALSLTAGHAIPLSQAGETSLDHTLKAKKVLVQSSFGPKEEILLSFPNVTAQRPKGSEDDPDYATYGYARTSVDVMGANWEKYNRISFQVYPECEGDYVLNLDLSFNNGAKAAKEGYLEPTGAHLVQLRPRQWNECILEIADLQRDSVVSLGISSTIRGKGISTIGDSTVLHIKDFRIQKVKDPESITGWQVRKGDIAYSMTGYDLHGKKTAIASNRFFAPRRFSLLSPDGKVVFKAKAKKTKTSLGVFRVLDFTSFSFSGTYTLKYGKIRTAPFEISDNVFESVQTKLLSFLYNQRCGDPVEGVHDACHKDMFAVHDGKKIAYYGGWHDAGDLSQQTLQSADMAFSLLEAARKAKSAQLKDALMEESLRGWDFILRCRFGDGYHASSMGLVHWTDGEISTFDDIYTVRTQNFAFDNFLYSGYEAYAALVLNDKALAEAALADYGFAKEKFDKDGYDHFVQPYEHTYNTSHSLYQAVICWSSVMLYRLTGDLKYACEAEKAAEYFLSCQRTEPLGDGLEGFFYRDTRHISINHFIHQSRDQFFAMAMDALCRYLPDHPSHAKWEGAMKLYSNYLKNLMSYPAPYGMMPSGVYNAGEPSDTEGFFALHLFPPENAPEQYADQFAHGSRIDSEHAVRLFPIWFNIFNGNNAIILSTGKAAAVCGNYFKDETLLQIGREQLYWTLGKNPFCQSLIYGEGHNYPVMNNFSSGTSVGEIPVGIRSLKATDEPYWPMINNACYKEVWVSSAARWFTLVSEY